MNQLIDANGSRKKKKKPDQTKQKKTILRTIVKFVFGTWETSVSLFNHIYFYSSATDKIESKTAAYAKVIIYLKGLSDLIISKQVSTIDHLSHSFSKVSKVVCENIVPQVSQAIANIATSSPVSDSQSKSFIPNMEKLVAQKDSTLSIAHLGPLIGMVNNFNSGMSFCLLEIVIFVV